ncbi:LysR family transcriptional regulator [Cupriavidus sp. M-11]|uniref:LysR family transcriptional regulator n=1 Tax=Cupriavidus sp. M-11 TaxID=3233038 RepID=UPI003F91B9B2
MALRKYQHFVTLIEAGSFARAADELHLSQPALTRSIQALESELGKMLIDRAYGRAALTAEGLVVLERARRMLREAREMKRDLEMMQDLTRGHIRVGFGALAASFLLDPVLAMLLGRYPGLRVDVEIDEARALGERIEAEELDVFLGESTSIDKRPQLLVEDLPPIETGFFVRAGHPLARKSAVALQDLLGYPVAGPHLPKRIAAMLRQRLDEQVPGTARDLLTVACDQLLTVRSLVLETEAVGLVPSEMMKAECAAGTARRLAVLGFDDMWSPYGVVTLAGRTRSPATQAFIAILQESVARYR